MNIAVLGAGAWGTAMALHLERLGHSVTLAPRRMEHALQIASARENVDYLPGYKLPNSLQVGCELVPILMEAELVILACPSSALRGLCEQVAAAKSSAWNLKAILTLCKGLEKGTLLLPAEVVEDVLPDIPRGVMSGPTNAAEVAQGQPSAIVLALKEEALAKEIQEAFSDPSLRVYRSADVTGVELGGALKNPYAIGAGICDGLGLGDNTRAAYLTRALHEMVRLGLAMGGKAETFYGLSGFGDLVATCNADWSRNRNFGYEFGKGSSVESLLENRKTVVEGYAATAAFHQLLKRAKKEAPLLSAIYAMLYKGLDPKEAIVGLMTRSLKKEH